jgi:hypothetical protein
MNQEQISETLHKLVSDFVSERAYSEVFNLSASSQRILFEMQSNVVNAQHIWGDVIQTSDPAVRKLSITICIRNLQTFIEAAAAARELYLILPDHLIDYQDRAEKIIQSMNNILTPG